ncbi:TRAP transporter large permease [Salinarimonas chemoclinalis]|uniref:TRAP transporter large permease n=1 Tax=Salinarimonas chemoclinalis TaxID=3241599 RepID=UPI00355899C1
MSAVLVENLAPIMFGSLVLFMLLGYPIAFSLAALGLGFGFLGIELGLFAPGFFQALPDRVFGAMANETLLAIPFFTFMGIVLERSRMAEDLLDTMGQLFGSVRGGLAYAVIFVGALLAATTGVVAAAVISMGLISLPIMLRYGYDRRLATGVIVASGTLAQILPPSLVLIVLADQLGRSVGDMYAGAMLPALMLTAAFALYVFVNSLLRPAMAPPLPKEARRLGTGIASLLVLAAAAIGVGWGATLWFEGRVEQAPYVWGAAAGVLLAFAVAWANRRLKLGVLSRLAEQVTLVLVPPLALIFLVLGTIFVGLATPTEGGAMGAVGALALAVLKGRLSLRLTREAAESTLRLSAFVMFVLIGARVFSLTFYGVSGHIWVKDLLLALPGGEAGFLLFVGLTVFFLGFFLDFFEIVFILVPLLVAPAQALGIDLVWFGVLLAVNFQTSFLTPPFGFSLFYLRSVTPSGEYEDAVTGARVRGVDTLEIYRGVIPFVAIQVMMIVVVYLAPGLVTHYRSDAPVLDEDQVRERLDRLIMPGLGDGGGGPGGGFGPGFGPPQMPSFAPPAPPQ